MDAADTLGLVEAVTTATDPRPLRVDEARQAVVVATAPRSTEVDMARHNGVMEGLVCEAGGHRRHLQATKVIAHTTTPTTAPTTGDLRLQARTVLVLTAPGKRPQARRPLLDMGTNRQAPMRPILRRRTISPELNRPRLSPASTTESTVARLLRWTHRPQGRHRRRVALDNTVFGIVMLMWLACWPCNKQGFLQRIDMTRT